MADIKVLVIDGQGGGLGRQLISALKDVKNIHLMAVGTNSSATDAMRKAGAQESATGENAVRVACRRADIIIGAVGILMADAFLGEITSDMALAIGASDAEKILIPMTRCGITIAGTANRTISQCVDDAVSLVKHRAG